MMCRGKISGERGVSCERGCLLVHKPSKHDLNTKYFAIGFKKTGTSTMSDIFHKLGLKPECSGEDRVKAVKALVEEKDNGKLALEVAQKYKVFQVCFS